MAGEAAAGEQQAEPGTAGEPAPVPGGQPPATGDPRVDAALARLGELTGLPVTEHARVFNDVHRQLEDVLDELDTVQTADASRDNAARDDAARGHRAAPGPGR
jgi:hypothetical protein